jgi:glutamate synthase (ferredoxin)
VQRTGSPLGVKLLYRFGDIAGDFVKVIPRECKHIMELTDKLEASGLTHDEAVERAFELRDAS